MSMDKLIGIVTCADGLCCCLPPRVTVALISILSLVVCLTDLASTWYDSTKPCCALKEYVESTRLVLAWFSLVANVLLFVSSVMEIAMLVEVYVWIALGFILMGLGAAILELLFGIKHEGVTWIANFIIEVLFLFVISRCLPIVNMYKKHLESYPRLLPVNPLGSEDLLMPETRYFGALP